MTLRRAGLRRLKQHFKKPYWSLIIFDKESQTYTGRILELPGCIAQGNTAEEVYVNLQRARKSWVEAALDLGQTIPEPIVYEKNTTPPDSHPA